MANGNGKMKMDEAWAIDTKLRNYHDLYAEDQRKVENEFSELDEKKQLELVPVAPLKLQAIVVVAAIEKKNAEMQKLFDMAHTIIPALACETENGILLLEILTVRENKPSTEGNAKIYKKVQQLFSATS